MDLVIASDDPGVEDVRLLLERHLEFARAGSPPEHVHALDIESLRDPAVSFFSARREGELLGVGALKRLDAVHVEIKSMHTSVEARRRGVGRAMVDHLLAVAADQHYRRVSLETGTADDFAPARSMYLKLGFLPCEPFGIYTVNPYSVCMTLELDPPLTASPGDEPGRPSSK